MRALVTGASGFVGRYLVDALRRDGAEVLACGGPRDGGDYFAVDVNDVQSLRSALETARPEVIFHLAGQTFVPESLEAPIESLEINVMGTARLAQAVREYRPTGVTPRIVFTSSAEVYGVRDLADYPLKETLDLRPSHPYGAGKAAAEGILLAGARGFGLDVVIARAFNHIGVGQNERFVVASFAAQLARIAQGAPPLLMVGDLSAARDFLDVRDVVAAYLALAQRGESAHVYNVCSGRAVAIRDVLSELIRIARTGVEVREDPDRMRAVEVPLSVGSSEKLRERTGWQPQIPLVHSLREIYAAAVGHQARPLSSNPQ